MKKFTLSILLATSLISSVSYAADTAEVAKNEAPKLIGLPNPNAEVLAVSEGFAVVTDKNAAAYFKLDNASKSDVTLVGVSAAEGFADKVELHKTVTDAKGVSTMQPLDKIVVPAEGSFDFKQGADHVMILGIKNPLKSGDKLELVLHFEGDKTQNVTLEVK
jgi:copper(I)-binding protein